MQQPLTPPRSINGAKRRFDDYRDGYGNHGSSGVDNVAVLNFSTGTVVENANVILEEMLSVRPVTTLDTLATADLKNSGSRYLDVSEPPLSRPITSGTMKLSGSDQRKESR